MSWLQEAKREQEAIEKSAKLADKEKERERRRQIYAYDADLKNYANEVRGKLLPKWKALGIDQMLVDVKNEIYKKDDLPKLSAALYVPNDYRRNGGIHYFTMEGWTLQGKRQNLVNDITEG